MVDEPTPREERGLKVPWTPRVLALLGDWQTRAAISQEAHYARATTLTRFNLFLGIPVVVLATLVGTSVFATVQERQIDTEFQIAVGFVSVLAAVLASLQTFLRFQERAEKHRSSAERWAAIRREIDQMLALHPEYLADRTDPKAYLDDLRRRMDEVSGQSLEIGDREWTNARNKVQSTQAASAEPVERSAEASLA